MKQQSTLLRLVIILLFIFSTILTTAAVPYATAKAIYVDGTNGAVTNDGLSLTKAKKTIQQAVDLALPGDTIYVRAGTYYENVIVSKSGLAGAPITLTRYNTDTVILNGGSEIALRAKGQINYWTIDSLTLRSTNRYTIRLGWWGEPTTSYWTVRNNKIYGANFLMGSYHLWENNNIDGTGYTVALGDAGISDAGDSHHNIYRGNTVHDFTHYDARGIWTQGFTHDTLIENNYVYNIMASSGLGQCIDLDGAAKVEWRHIVRGNTVSNCSYVGIQLENSFATIVEKNTILESGNAGIIVINYNASVGCPSGGEYDQYGDTNGDNSCRGDDTDNTLRQNVIANAGSFKPGYGGIINWYAGGVDMWGNTISSASGSGNGGINIQGTAAETQGTTLINNIIKTGSGVSICAQDLKAITVANNNLVNRDNNLAQFASGTGCGTQYTLAQFKTATGLGSNTLVADPRFTNVSAKNFSLLLDSPAIDTGVSVGTTTDIDGLPRPSGAACDIGAHEFQGQAAAPTPTSAPVLISFTRQDPLNNPTDADSLVFRAIFNEGVQGVDAGDFMVDGSTTAIIANIAEISADVYEITVSGGDLSGFNGTIGLNLAQNQNITSLNGNPFPNAEPAIDETYILENQTISCYPLTISHDGNGSNPSANPPQSAGCGTSEYMPGETITLSGAIADEGWRISGWSGSANDASNIDSNNLTMPANAHTVKVVYQQMTVSQVVLANPAEGFSTTDHTPNLDWEDVPNAEFYNIQVSPQADFSILPINHFVTESWFAPGVAMINQTYWWRVSAKVDGVWSGWSESRTITITGAPGQPAAEPIGPDDGASTSNTKPTFDWTDVPTAAQYRIHVSESPDFKVLLVNQLTPISEFTPGIDIKAGTYYWRVQAMGGGDASWFTVKRMLMIN